MFAPSSCVRALILCSRPPCGLVGQFDKAIEVLKSYENKDHTLVAHAATNLSFIYFHEADFNNAVKYADIAMKHNRYNAKALVNKGNCMFMRNDLEHAR